MRDLSLQWWKWLCMVLLLFSVTAGMLLDVPRLAILNESIRNLYFHVPMWFGMVIMLAASLFYSIRFLSKGEMGDDLRAVELVNTSVLFGLLGLATGSIWARFTWGAWWVNDTKLNGAAISMLIYLAYVVLRGSLPDPRTRGRISAIYNIFAFAVLIPLLFILPRMTDSLHPGNGGNPGFSAYEKDLDSTMRMVFYPAIIGWTLLGIWMSSLHIRLGQWAHNFKNRPK